eukprot:TRINITY_DN86_c0_g3_i1.p1 TRINITY_DN86_c0_g3~~TRINITY_DN86_c0_g3_i1.p1  ORF type:complete len:326 (-),score=140.46 TRINITY_DN86_c0_g3_i1:37-960(-)
MASEVQSMRRVGVLLGHLAPQRRVIPSLAQNLVSGATKKLQGQVAIVTGAGQGIGAASAKRLAAEGAHVVVSDLDVEKSNAVAKEINEAGGSALSVAGDVTDPAFPQKIIKATVSKFGKLNILVNNAGYTWDALIHKTSDKQFEAMLAVHNVAPFRLIRAAASVMTKKELAGENRSIINVSSTSGLHGNIGQTNYACAKAGVLGLTKSVAKEWGAAGVRCNSIAFGWIETRLTSSKEQGASIVVDGQQVNLGIPDAVRKMMAKSKASIPLQRAGTVDEAAGAVYFLASPDSSYITGHTLEVTGGAGI